MHLKRDNIEFTTCDNSDQIIGLETQIRGNILSLIVFIYLITNAIKLTLNGLVIKLIVQTGKKKNKAIINTKKDDDKRFQYEETVALNLDRI